MSNHVESFSRFASSALFTIGFFSLEMYLWIKYLEGSISLAPLLGFHLMITAASFFLMIILAKMGWRIRFMVITTLLIGLMGPFGAAMSLGFILFYGGYLLVVDPIFNLISMLMPSPIKTRSSELYDRIKFGMETYDISSDPTPLHEVIKFGSVSQKLSAIEKMLKFYHPEFIPALTIALSDPNNSVRVMAATAIANLEDRFHRVYVALEKKHEQDPKDPQIILELADHCNEYSQATIFDNTRLTKMRSIALDKYKEYLTMKPEDPKARQHLGELYFNQGDLGHAEEKLVELTTSHETFSLLVYILLMRIFYRRREFHKMRQFTADHFSHLMDLASEEESHEFEEVLFSWGGSVFVRKLLGES